MKKCNLEYDALEYVTFGLFTVAFVIQGCVNFLCLNIILPKLTKIEADGN